MFLVLIYLYIILVLTIVFIYNAYRETHKCLLNNKLETSKLLVKIQNRFDIFEFVETDKRGIIINAKVYDKL